MRRKPDRAALMVALIALGCVGAAGCGSSATKPATQAVSATRSPPAAAQTFTSKRYRFRVTLTKAWTEADALDQWNGKQLQGLASRAFANFTDGATGRALAAAAAPVTKGMELDKWRMAMVRATPDVCSEPSSAKGTTLGGEPALAWTTKCSDGYDVDKVAALHGRRGYMILLASKADGDHASDRRVFESMRGSFRFAP